MGFNEHKTLIVVTRWGFFFVWYNLPTDLTNEIIKNECRSR